MIVKCCLVWCGGDYSVLCVFGVVLCGDASVLCCLSVLCLAVL